MAEDHFDQYGSNRVIPRAMTAFTAIAWYNALELFFLLFLIFKKYSGLYFWSLLVTTISVVPYATGELALHYLLHQFLPVLGAWVKLNNVSHHTRLNEAILLSSWIIMVPGQSLVMYSRLHLISQNKIVLGFVLWMIIINAVLLCVPTAVLDIGQYTSHPEVYTRGYMIMERIQMTMFAAQEIVISLIYLCEVYKILKFALDGNTRRAMWQLAAMNLLHLVLDLTLLAVEFLGMHMIEATLKGLIYSVKLKIEFAVLNQLVRVMRDRNVAKDFTINISKCTERASEETLEVTEIRQRNVPREWRLSVGVSQILTPQITPSPVNSTRRSGEQSPTYSIGSVDRMYPGRLG